LSGPPGPGGVVLVFWYSLDTRGSSYIQYNRLYTVQYVRMCGPQ